MSITWTTEQVLALSPDANSKKNGKKLATSSKWQALGYTETATWGECRGSGKNPYRTQIDLTEPAFRCSCPSRKFPCKHALALFLLLTGQPESFSETNPPDWVREWLEKRAQTSQKKQEKQKAVLADPEAQAKRVQKREDKIQAGLVDLDLWLRDLMRQGLATAQNQSYSFWDQPAARMVDAQAPALARRLREMASLPHRGVDWPSQLLAELGQLHLLIQGYQRQETLPSEVVAELRSQLGWTQKQEELLAISQQADSGIEKIHDTWAVVGLRAYEEDNLRVQRVWLQGQTRSALILSFAYGSNPLDTSLLPGTSLEADLVFYPGLYPLRSLVKDRGEVQSLESCPQGLTMAEGMATYGSAIATNPWLAEFPLLLRDVVPCPQSSGWCLKDIEGHQLELNPIFTKDWELLALSGGHPVTIMGEWDGQVFLPLSLWVNDRFVAL